MWHVRSYTEENPGCSKGLGFVKGTEGKRVCFEFLVSYRSVCNRLCLVVVWLWGWAPTHLSSVVSVSDMAPLCLCERVRAVVFQRAERNTAILNVFSAHPLVCKWGGSKISRESPFPNTWEHTRNQFSDNSEFKVVIFNLSGESVDLNLYNYNVCLNLMVVFVTNIFASTHSLI